jgi:chitinase
MKYKSIHIKGVLLFATALIIFSSFTTQKKHNRSAARQVIIGYVGGYRGAIHADSIDVSRLTHINYAFVDIKDNRAWLHNGKNDEINLKKLAALKAKNAALKILISVGGWTWSKHFSDAVLTDTSTKNFAQSAIAIVAKYGLDGVDIDWEYPGMEGDSNVYRPEDKQGYTRLFKDLRQGFDSLKKITKQHYFVTTAVGASKEFIEHTEMAKVQQYTDFINLMTYDFTDGDDTVAIHHTNLYASATHPANRLRSADICAKEFMAAGVPAEKLVMGVAFYGHAMEMRSAENHGLNQKAVKAVRVGGFSYIHDSLVNKRGYVRYWDSAAHAPYLFNEERKIFITYDDEESVKDKCGYVKQHGLGGVMFWEYFNDKREYLLKTITDNLNYK